MCESVCPKNSSQTVNGSDLKFLHLILYASLRSAVLFSIFNFQVFQLPPFPKSYASFKLDSHWNKKRGGSRMVKTPASHDGSTDSNLVAGAPS